MLSSKVEAFAWPAARLADALCELAVRSGIGNGSPEFSRTCSCDSDPGEWLDWAAKHFSCEAEPIQSTLRDLDRDLACACPGLIRVSEGAFLAVVKAGKHTLRVLTPELEIHRIALVDVCDEIRKPVEQAQRSELAELLAAAGIRERFQGKAMRFLLNDQLGNTRFDQCWLLRPHAGATPMRLLRETGAVQNAAALIGAHTLQYLLWLVSWAILGRLSLEGRMDRGWLLAWALLLFTLIPCQVLTTWCQGLFAIGLGSLLKRRLLYGAMRLAPEEMRHQGIGSFLGQALEAEAVETLALSGGIAGLLAAVEIVVAGFVLGPLAFVLAAWLVLAIAVGYRFLRRYQRWTDTRMALTQDLVESMVGHRTRLAQQRREEWHEREDQALHRYMGVSFQVDRAGAWLIAAIPRGWLIAALACLSPAVMSRDSVTAATAVKLGGILLAYNAFRKLTWSSADVAAAWVACKRIAPLFQAAGRDEVLGGAPARRRDPEPAQRLVEADRLSFRYRKQGTRALQSCSLAIRYGDRVLLEGPSGGGKTTFASLLTGMRQPESGLVLAHGLDRHTLGDRRWRQIVAAAPQFHENHILTETLAFNILMGRGWPPNATDFEEAETVCRELGLGNLLDTMPSGLLQMVGEGGWQLSHGERSRVFIARALLQDADLVILDESFAALDPENLQIALECTLRRSKTLLVIAHP
jgi:ATP-binding cassette subfamily B protein